MKLIKKLSISDDSGFIGIANLDKYDSFISPDWDLEMLKNRIVNQINSNNIIFWATGGEGYWKVQISTGNHHLNKDLFRTEEALIEVTSNKLHLVNYETLSMAAQFRDIILPERHLENLVYELENGLYHVEFGQLSSPDQIENRSDVDFEIRLEIINDENEYYPNNFKTIFWNIY